MKTFTRCLSAVLALISLTVALTAAFFGLLLREREPVLMESSPEARATAVELMECLCAGDYEGASQRILGQPDLGVDREARGTVGRCLWDAYQESLTYETVGDCYATDLGVTQDFTLHYLDLESMMESIGKRAPALLEARVEAATDMSEIYNSQNEYREDVVVEVVMEAIDQILQTDVPYITHDFSVHMVFCDGAWYAVNDEELRYAISGSMVR